VKSSNWQTFRYFTWDIRFYY